MTIDKARVKTEIKILEEDGFSVQFDLDKENFVALEMLPFPRQWEPRRGALVFQLPDNYPLRQPDAYLPEFMQFKGERPMIMLDSGPNGWSKHCIHNLRDTWVPEYHTMVTMLRMIQQSLEYPNDSDPWKAAKKKYWDL
jgi:ubiquitin-protein ligase